MSSRTNFQKSGNFIKEIKANMGFLIIFFSLLVSLQIVNIVDIYFMIDSSLLLGAKPSGEIREIDNFVMA
jgi:hypothetical protein